MSLGSTQPLVETSTRDSSDTVMCRLSRNPGSLNLSDCQDQSNIHTDSIVFTIDMLNVVNSKLHRNNENSFFLVQHDFVLNR